MCPITKFPRLIAIPTQFSDSEASVRGTVAADFSKRSITAAVLRTMAITEKISRRVYFHVNVDRPCVETLLIHRRFTRWVFVRTACFTCFSLICFRRSSLPCSTAIRPASGKILTRQIFTSFSYRPRYFDVTVQNCPRNGLPAASCVHAYIERPCACSTRAYTFFLLSSFHGRLLRIPQTTNRDRH